MTLMLLSLQSLLIAGTAFASVAIAQLDPALTGTWTTKSRKVLTGPVGIPATYSTIQDTGAKLVLEERAIADRHL